MKADVKLAGTLQVLVLLSHTAQQNGDSRLHKGVTQSIQEANPSHQVKCLADLVRLSHQMSKEKTFSPTSFQV